MRIVTREELHAMPAGTVYMVPFQEENSCGIYPGIYIKTCSNPIAPLWYCIDTSNWRYNDDDPEDFSRSFSSATSSDVPMDYETEELGQDDIEDDRRFVVLSKDDVAALCVALVRARK